MTEKILVRLEPLGKTIRCIPGTPLMDVIHEYGIEFPCGGKGTCGSCKVKLLDGHIEMDEQHLEDLKKMSLDTTWRLACKSIVSENVTLEVGQFDSIILADNSSYDFIPIDGLGIAIDLGTTTIVSQLIDLNTGKVLNVQTKINPQSKCGADIMARISYAMEENGMEELTKTIRETIHSMIKLQEITPFEKLKRIVIVGNTVMHHLFCGIAVNSLSIYPFESDNAGIKHFSSKDLNWDLKDNVEISFLPSIGSFVGSDILAGILSTRLHESEKYIALIDLGTNGEIAVGNKDKIIVASTAAGPAFEGTNIMMGMKATSGAISKVNLINENITCHTIGNVPSLGICGSGLIDAIRHLNKIGEIDSGGQIKDEKRKLDLDQNVFLSQKDIREFQLAKAAISAGLFILCKKLGIQPYSLDILYIAGGFGHFINLDNAIEIGLIEIAQDKIEKRGNSALIGAKMMLFHDYSKLNDILNISEHYSLEGDPEFQDIYVDKMFFK